MHFRFLSCSPKPGRFKKRFNSISRIQVKYRAANSGDSWADVSQLLTAEKSLLNNETQTFGTPQEISVNGSSIAVGELTSDEVKISFSDLPVYNKDGIPYEYRVFENSIGGQAVTDNRKYLFNIPAPSEAGWESSFVTKMHTGVSNYFVDYTNTSGSTTIKNTVVNDAVSYVHVVAEKIWKDENNLYGKRPETITYKLTRKKSTVDVVRDENGDIIRIDVGVPVDDPDFQKTQATNEEKNWKAAWSHCAAFEKTGSEDHYSEYEYFITELPVADYETTQKDDLVNDESGDLTKSYTFTNTYEPEKKKLTLTKTWDDETDKFGYRPDEVTYELYCKYDVYEYNKYTEGDNAGENIPQDLTKTDSYDGKASLSALKDLVYKTRVDSETGKTVPVKMSEDYEFVKTVSRTSRTGNTETVEFDNLPAWVNPTGDGRYNGQFVEVTYYVKETVDGNVTRTYICGDAADNGKSTETTLNRAKTEEDTDSRLIICGKVAEDKTASLTNKLDTRDIIVALNWNDNGYKDNETDKANALHYNTEVTLACDQLYTYTNNFDPLTATGHDNAATYVRDADSGIVTIPQSEIQTITDGENTQKLLSISFKNLLKVNGCTYTVVECDANGVPLETQSIAVSSGSGATAFRTELTVTKDYSDAEKLPENIYFKVMKTEAGVTTLVRNIHHDDPVSFTSNKVIAVKDSEGHSVVKNGVSFADVPIYSADGKMLSYRTEEKPWCTDQGAYIETPTAEILAYQIAGAYDALDDKTQYQDADENEAVSGVTLLTVRDDDRRYGYDGSVISYKDETLAGKPVTQFNILNTLPLTSVKAVKHWDDQSNKFNLRPAAPTGDDADPLGLELKTKPVAETSLDDTAQTGADTSGWAAPGCVEDSQPTVSGNTWTYT